MFSYPLGKLPPQKQFDQIRDSLRNMGSSDTKADRSIQHLKMFFRSGILKKRDVTIDEKGRVYRINKVGLDDGVIVSKPESFLVVWPIKDSSREHSVPGHSEYSDASLLTSFFKDKDHLKTFLTSLRDVQDGFTVSDVAQKVKNQNSIIKNLGGLPLP